MTNIDPNHRQTPAAKDLLKRKWIWVAGALIVLLTILLLSRCEDRDEAELATAAAAAYGTMAARSTG
jgi:hypothetical protein